MEPILYLPIFVAVFIPLLLFVTREQTRRRVVGRWAAQRRAARRNQSISTGEEESAMSNELIQSLIGKTVQISTGSLGESFDKVVVLAVEENWIRVQRKNKIRLINSDYITSVKILDEGSDER